MPPEPAHHGNNYKEITVDDTSIASKELAEYLLTLAAIVESTPDLEPMIRSAFDRGQAFVGHQYPETESALALFARAARRHGGKITKQADGDKYFDVVATFGPFQLTAYARRDEVCERIVTGVETVTKSVPDPTALAAVPTVEITEQVEQVKWVCRPLLASEKADAGTRVTAS